MKVGKNTVLFLKGVGYLTSDEILKMVMGGQTPEVRGIEGSWVKVTDGCRVGRTKGIKLESGDKCEYTLSDDTVVFTLDAVGYCLKGKDAEDLTKTDTLVYNATYNDEDTIMFTSKSLHDFALIMNHCSYISKHNYYPGYQFTSANLDVVKKCYDTFVPKDVKIAITHDGRKCQNSIYKFTIPFKHASKIKTLIDRFEYDIETKHIPNTLLNADRESRVEFYKWFSPIHFGKYNVSRSSKTKSLLGVVTRKSKGEIISYKRFLATLGILGNIVPTKDSWALTVSSDMAAYAKDIDEGFKPEYLRGHIFAVPLWNRSVKDNMYPASNRAVFIAMCKVRQTPTYRFIRDFYEYYEPLKIKSLKPCKEEMVELVVDGFAEIGGIFVR